MFFAGVDGCPCGWFVVFREPESRRLTSFVVPFISDLLAMPFKLSAITIDIPIGLLEKARRGGRLCDIEARKLLSGKRASSVFSRPIREAIKKKSYALANAANRESSTLVWGSPSRRSQSRS